MPDVLYGGTAGDFFMTVDPVTDVLSAAGGATGTVWTARTGGTQITALKTLAGVAATVVTGDATGDILFFAPDTSPLDLWVTAGAERRLVRRTDIGALITSLLARVATLEARPVPVTTADLNTAIAAAVAAEVTARDAAIAAHNNNAASHPNKVTAMNGPQFWWDAGNVPGTGNVPMPTVADGVDVGHKVVVHQ